MFKRRDRRSLWQAVLDFIYPRGGWARAFGYVKHRLRRLPDTPEKISRGIWAGVFTAFTPFYGLHFIVAAIIAKLMRGNVVAALMGTFFGNPLTYVPIGVSALSTGYWILGLEPERGIYRELGRKFGDAWGDIWHNIKALFTADLLDWTGLTIFYEEVFYPYLIGGLIPGVIAATVCYFIFVPLISAYQNRRRRILRAKLDQLNDKSSRPPSPGGDLG